MTDQRNAALKWLLGRINYERTLTVPNYVGQMKLDRMRRLLTRLGHPESDLKIIHVAGTKGKGSTSAMIASVLSAAGYRTGLYCSPHLDRIEERMAVDGQACSPLALVRLVEWLRPIVEDMDRHILDGQNTDGSVERLVDHHSDRKESDPPAHGPTYFEIMTAMALRHFAASKVDVAILEVGLGGRLDSTNVCEPVVSIITSISFDHMLQLGNSLEAIAGEKAGIIKSGMPVVSGVLQPDARRVIQERAQRHGCPLRQMGDDFQYVYHTPRAIDQEDTGATFDFRYLVAGHGHEYSGVPLPLLGSHQAANAAVALATVAELRGVGWHIPESAERSGLAQIVLPARLELVGRRPTVIVDAAHNVASVEALIQVLNESCGSRRRLLVFATSQDKDVNGMLRVLLPQFDQIVLTRYCNNPRAVPPSELYAAARAEKATHCPVFDLPSDAWDHVRREMTENDLVVVTGSFYIAAEMRRLINEKPFIPDPLAPQRPVGQILG